QPPGLCAIGADIAGKAEIGGMPERQKAGVAEQKVERAGEQRKAHHLHDEARVEHERRDDARSHRRHGDRGVVAGHAARGLLHLYSRCCDGSAHYAVPPDSPAGLISRTIAMMTKVTTAEASG